MVSKCLLLFCLVTLSNLTAAAQEIWLEPQRFYADAGEEVNIVLKTGDDFIGVPWPADPARITRLEQHRGQSALNLKDDLRTVTKRAAVLPASDAKGLAFHVTDASVVIMETEPMHRRLASEAFTAYLKKEGLDEIFFARKKSGVDADSVAEQYSWHTKLLLPSGGDDLYRKAFGLPLEIIPAQDPAQLKKGDRVAFRILFGGKPLFGAKVQVWNRHNHRVSVQNIYSQQDGRIETHISNPGAWMVSVARMEPSAEGSAAYRTYRSTLVFAVR